MKLIKLFLIFTLSCLYLPTLANHILGGNISYECLGGDEYEITFTIYKDCLGATSPAPVEDLFFIPNGCSSAFSAPSLFQSETEISDLCPSELLNSSCSGGFIPGVLELTYSVTVTLDPACTWTVSWASGGWNYFVNMDNSSLPFAQIETTIDPTLGCNSSIEISDTNNDIPYYCSGEAVVNQLEVDNPDGYTLTYSLCDALTTGGVTAPYDVGNGYSGAQPIPGIAIDPATGEITFTAPGQFGNYLVTICIEMYDGGGNLVGTFMQNMAYVIRLCTISPTNFIAPGVLTANSDVTIVSGTEVFACVGDSLCFTVSAENGNVFRTITMSSDFTTLFPGGTFTTDGTNPVTGEVCVLVDETMIGNTDITFDVIDDGCPVPEEDQLIVAVTVSPSLEINLTDATVCNGDNIVLTATGDTDYSWNVISGTASPSFAGTGGTQDITPTSPMVVEVVANNADAACNTMDTLTIDVSLWDLDFNVTDETCNGNDGEIDLTVSGGSGNYGYDWDIPDAVEDPVGVTGGTWEVTVEDIDFNCFNSDTISVGTSPPPSGDITGDITICEGECTSITFNLSGTPTFDATLMDITSGTPVVVPPVSDADTLQVCPTVTTVYELQSITDSNTPQCTYNTPSQVTVTVRPLVNASFIDPGNLCAGDDVDLEFDIDQAGTYNVIYEIGGSPEPVIAVSDGATINLTPNPPSTTYSITSVEYQDAPFCPMTTPFDLTINVDSLPTAVFTTSDTICDGEDAIIHLSLTGTGPWTISYTENGGAVQTMGVAFNEFDWLIAPGPSVDTEYCITHVLDTDTGCEQDVTSCTDVFVNTLPNGSLSTDGTICNGDEYPITMNLTGNGPFTVSIEDGAAVDLAIANPVADQDTFMVSPTNSEMYCLTEIIDNNGCLIALNDCINVTVNPLPTIDIAGNDLICTGDCYDLVVNNMTGTAPFGFEYELFAADDDASISVNNVGAMNNGDMITVCPTEDAYIVINQIVDSSAPACTNADVAGQFDITVNEYSTVSVSQDSTICLGGTPILTFCFDNYASSDNLTITLTDGQNFSVLGSALDANGCYDFSPIDPLVNTTYTIDTFTNDNNICTQIVDDVVDIIVSEVPTATLASDQTICLGVDADIQVDIPSAGGPFDIIVEVGSDASELIYEDIADGFIFQVSPNQTDTYTLTFIADSTSAAACNSNPASMVTVTIPDLPQIGVLDTLCSNTGEDFQIQFEITGGDAASYNVFTDLGNDPGGLISAGPPYIYTSGVITAGLGECWNVDDVTSCPADTTCIAPFACPVITYSGTIDTSSVLVCCDGDFCITQNGDQVLDDNDVMSYVIMNDPDFNTALILDVSDVNCWDIATDLNFPPFVCGNTYYVVAIAGNDDGGGLVDLTNADISISEAMAVTLVDIPSADISGGGTVCEGDSVQITIDLAGSSPWNFEILLDAVVYDDVSGITVTPYTFYTQDAGAYTLANVNNTTCVGNANGLSDVVVNPIPTATISNDGNICEGDNWDFDVDLTGTAPWDFTVSYDDGVNPIVDDVVAGVAVNPTTYQANQDGEYFITEVSDATGCTNLGDSPIVTLVVNSLPDASFDFGDSSYCAGSSIDLLITLDGLADWTIDYNIDNAATQQWTPITDSTFTQNITTPGTYEIESVTDGNNCTALINESIVISEIPIPVADAGADVSVCSNIDQIIGTPDDPTLSYSWTGDIQIINDTTSAQPTVNAINLGPGVDVYNLTLTVDDNSCSAQDDIVVTLEPEPNADAGEDVSICYGEQYQLASTGGDECLWTDNGTFVDPVDICDPFIQTIVTTTYVVQVTTSSNNCSAMDTVIVNVPEEFLLDIDFSSEVCFGACDGNINITPQGGYPGYTIAWDLALDSLIETGVCAGMYTYTVTDSLNCELTGDIEILELPIYEVDTILISHPTCFQFEDGQIEIVSPQTVEFILLGVDTNATGIFTDLPAGVYDILVTNNIGCQTMESVELIDISDEIFITNNFDVEVTCFEEPTEFIANALGGFGEFEYNWYDNVDLNPPSIFTGDTLVLSPSDTTIVWVVAIDEVGCNSDTLEMMTIFNPPIQISSMTEDSIEMCQGECIDLFVNVYGGNGEYSYDWVQIIDPVDIPLGNASSQNVCPMENSIYSVTVSDQCSPDLNTIINVVVHETPDTEIFSDSLIGCYPLTITLNNITDTSLVNTCIWDFGDGNTQAICSDVTYTYSTEGIYYPTLTVTTEFGCTNTDSTEFMVEVYGYPEVDFEWEPNPVTTLENEVQFLNLTTNAVTYNWDIGGLLSTTEPNPSIILPPTDMSSYYVCLEATTEHGCIDTLCKIVPMESILLIWVPNAFTPDGDGINDEFLPSVMGVDPSEYTFRVWDRWGHIIFETSEFGVPWVGDFKGGTHYVQNDVYVWQIEAKEIATEEIKVFTGTVTIFR